VNRFQRSFALLSASLAVVRAERRLLWLPVMSAVFTLIATLLIFVPVVALALAGGSAHRQSGVIFFAGTLLAAYAATTVATFFNVALVSCAARHFHGNRASLAEGFAAAGRRLGAILIWALIATAVGTLLRAVDQRAGLLGSIVTGLVGAAWSVATYFVVPVLAFEQVGPTDAIGRSVAIVRRSWGEGLIGNAGLGIATFVLAVPVGLVGAVGLNMLATDRGAAMVLLLAAGAGLITLAVISSALGQIYKTAVYLYAADGDVAGYSKDLLDGAFRPKRNS
jgi:uncharacterized protein DUF6159